MLNARRIYIVLIIGFLIGVTSVAEAQRSWHPGDTGSVRFRLGLFEPQADSSYWSGKFYDWTGNAEDFQDLVWGVDGVWMAAPTWGLLFGSSWYQGATTQSYRDYVDNAGQEISHRTELTTWDLTAAWLFKPLRGSKIRPYLGIGGGLLSWRLLEYGDFIDFGDDGAVVYATYGDEGTTFMAFALLGIEFFATTGVSFFVEGRWQEAESSGGLRWTCFSSERLWSRLEVSAGISWNF